MTKHGSPRELLDGDTLLDRFFDELENHWERLPSEERSSLSLGQRLRARTLIRAPGPWSMFRLREGLLACIVHSQAQREAFTAAFTAFFGALTEAQLNREFDVFTAERLRALFTEGPENGSPDTDPSTQNLTAKDPPGDPPEEPPTAKEPGPHGPVALLALAVFGALALLLYFQSPVRGWHASAADSGVDAGPDAGPDDGGSRDARAAGRCDSGPCDGYTSGAGGAEAEGPFPLAERTLEDWAEQHELAPSSSLTVTSERQLSATPFKLLALAGALMVLGAFGWIYRGAWPPRRRLKVPESAPSVAFGLQPEPGDVAEPHIKPDELDRLSMAVSLVLGAPMRPTIDVNESVRATVRNGGFPTLVAQDERRLRKVYLLANTETRVLRERGLHLELLEGLEQRGIAVELGYWHGSLRTYLGRNSPLPQQLSRLQQHEQGIVVLVLGDARHLANLDEELERLRTFSCIAWIDPRDPSCWGHAAAKLAEHIPLIPPTPEGWELLRRVLGRQALANHPLPHAARQAFRPNVRHRDPGVGPGIPSLSLKSKNHRDVREAHEVQAALGPTLVWAAALAMLPFPVPLWYAQRIRRELRDWLAGPGGEPHPGLRATFAALRPIELDRVRAIPGVNDTESGLSFDGPLARFLVREVLEERFPRVYRHVLRLHEATLERCVQPAGSEAELERQAGLALLQWQLAVAYQRSEALSSDEPRLDAGAYLRRAARRLRDLQNTRLHGWVHAFVAAPQASTATDSDDGRPEPFLPSPDPERLSGRTRLWVRSAIRGMDDPPRWSPFPTAYAVLGAALVLVGAYVTFTRHPGRVLLEFPDTMPLVSAAWRHTGSDKELVVRYQGRAEVLKVGEPETGETLLIRPTEGDLPQAGRCVDVDSQPGYTLLRCPKNLDRKLYPKPAAVSRTGAAAQFPAISIAYAPTSRLRTHEFRSLANRLLATRSVDLVVGLPTETLDRQRLRELIEREFGGTLNTAGSRLKVNRRGLFNNGRIDPDAHELAWNEEEELALQVFELRSQLVAEALDLAFSTREPTSAVVELGTDDGWVPGTRVVGRRYELRPFTFRCSDPASRCEWTGLYQDEAAFGVRVGARQPSFTVSQKLEASPDAGASLRLDWPPMYLAVGTWQYTPVCSEGKGPPGTFEVGTHQEVTLTCTGSSGAGTLELRGHSGPVRTATFSMDGTRVLTIGDDQTPRIWDASSGKLLNALPAGSGNKGVLSPGGLRTLVAGGKDAARIWNNVSAEPLTTLDHSGPADSLAFSSDGASVLIGSADGTARLWRSWDGGKSRLLQAHSKAVLSASFGSDSSQIVTASADGSAAIWGGRRDTKLLHELRGHTGEVHTAVFSPDARRIVTASADGTARIWDASSGTSLAVLRGHSLPVLTAAFSPDGRLILTASADRTARLWDTFSGTVFAALRGHRGGVQMASFSPDGRRVVTASEDGTARVWDVASGEVISEFRGHTRTVRTAVFSPDGSRVLTASDDGTARIWDSAIGRPPGRVADSPSVPPRPPQAVRLEMQVGAKQSALLNNLPWDGTPRELPLKLSSIDVRVESGCVHSEVKLRRRPDGELSLQQANGWTLEQPEPTLYRLVAPALADLSQLQVMLYTPADVGAVLNSVVVELDGRQRLGLSRSAGGNASLVATWDGPLSCGKHDLRVRVRRDHHQQLLSFDLPSLGRVEVTKENQGTLPQLGLALPAGVFVLENVERPPTSIPLLEGEGAPGFFQPITGTGWRYQVKTKFPPFERKVAPDRWDATSSRPPWADLGTGVFRISTTAVPQVVIRGVGHASSSTKATKLALEKAQQLVWSVLASAFAGDQDPDGLSLYLEARRVAQEVRIIDVFDDGEHGVFALAEVEGPLGASAHASSGEDAPLQLSHAELLALDTERLGASWQPPDERTLFGPRVGISDGVLEISVVSRLPAAASREQAADYQMRAAVFSYEWASRKETQPEPKDIAAYEKEMDARGKCVASALQRAPMDAQRVESNGALYKRYRIQKVITDILFDSCFSKQPAVKVESMPSAK